MFAIDAAAAICRRHHLRCLRGSLRVTVLRAATTKNIVTALNLPTDTEILFLLSITNQAKAMVLASARLLVYTPTNEHFGIVPLEAMLAGVPVLAANSGGPLETILDGQTGWLRPAEKVEEWTKVMQTVLQKMPDAQLRRMGEAGRARVKAEFSETKLAQRLDEEFTAMTNAPRAVTLELAELLLGVGVVEVLVVAAWIMLWT